MTWDEYQKLSFEEKTAIIKEKDAIIAFNPRLRFVLLTELGLMIIKITKSDEDMFGKVDAECIHISTGEKIYIQLKYTNLDWGDIRISEKELYALKTGKSINSYQIQIVGDQEYLNLNNSVNIFTIRICAVLFLREMIRKNLLIREEAYISTKNIKNYVYQGYGYFYYFSQENYNRGKGNLCCLSKNNGTYNLSLILKSIPEKNKTMNGDKYNKCYLIPATLNNILAEPMIKNFEKEYFAKLSF